MIYLIFKLPLLFFLQLTPDQDIAYAFNSPDLKIIKISDHVFQHISYLQTEDYGKVGCNGMIVSNEGEAIIFDTPVGEKAAEELINFISDSLQNRIVAVIPTHFHHDCLGTLDEFHKQQIPSYALQQTIILAKKNKKSIPENGFQRSREFKVGGSKVIVSFMGEGHTTDNIIGYFPEEDIMFGGCLVKSMGAGKGNLEDANVEAWSETIKAIEQKYKHTRIVIPGHGNIGNKELLTFTKNLFKE